MKAPKEIIRITLDKYYDTKTVLPYSGVYIIAYMGKVLYVGRASDMNDRMRQHIKIGDLTVDYWLRSMTFDFANIRVDILETPDDIDGKYWGKEAEARLITYFNPIFNDQCNNA